MKPISESRRKRIEMQGFTGLSDAELAEVAPWLRLAPAVLLVWTAVAMAMGSAAGLWALVPFAALGAVLPTHPFDLLYNHGLRFVLRTPPIPSYGAPRRFSWMLASALVVGTALALQLGTPRAGYLLGLLVLEGATTTVTTDFCTGSWIYGKLFGRPGVMPRQPAAGRG